MKFFSRTLCFSLFFGNLSAGTLPQDPLATHHFETFTGREGFW